MSQDQCKNVARSEISLNKKLVRQRHNGLVGRVTPTLRKIFSSETDKHGKELHITYKTASVLTDIVIARDFEKIK